jgi:hypothetical protein
VQGAHGATYVMDAVTFLSAVDPWQRSQLKTYDSSEAPTFLNRVAASHELGDGSKYRVVLHDVFVGCVA